MADVTVAETHVAPSTRQTVRWWISCPDGTGIGVDYTAETYLGPNLQTGGPRLGPGYVVDGGRGWQFPASGRAFETLDEAVAAIGQG